MAADAVPFGADPARGVRATINTSTVERAFARIVAIAGTGFGFVALPNALDQLFGDHAVLNPFWGPLIALGVAASIVFTLVSAVFQPLAQAAQIAMAMMFLVSLVTWPLVCTGALAHGQVPWPWWLCNIATGAAVMGLAPWRAAIYNVVLPAIYVGVRMTSSGGGVSVGRALLDGFYIFILAMATIALIVALRRTAARVDNAQAMAVRRYARAIREHATELERVQVDAIVHDSVLTTLLSAARAETPEAKTLAASMAKNAISHLAAASVDDPGDVPPVPIATLRSRISAAVAELAAAISVRSRAVDSREVPAAVADALASAALQASVNSVQHAGGPEIARWVSVTGIADGGVQVEIGDSGRGFDIHGVPAERLGVRRSIMERVAAVGGEAHVISAPGRGTRVVLTWSEELAARAAALVPVADDAEATS
jgi:signal transduction histidine kinase